MFLYRFCCCCVCGIFWKPRCRRGSRFWTRRAFSFYLRILSLKVILCRGLSLLVSEKRKAFSLEVLLDALTFEWFRMMMLLVSGRRNDSLMALDSVAMILRLCGFDVILARIDFSLWNVELALRE
jgi:hypothetical protein